MITPTFSRRAAGLFGLGAVLGGQVGFPAHAAEARDDLQLRLSFGHRSPTSATLTPRLVRGSPGLSVDAFARSITVGAGSVGMLYSVAQNFLLARASEFTDIRTFEAEMDRMPNFTLHELAHAPHHRMLADGFANAEIQAAHERATGSGRYDRVERWFGTGKTNTFERAYAMNNPMEYFAETTEAFFSRNDFFPLAGDELEPHAGATGASAPNPDRAMTNTAPAQGQTVSRYETLTWNPAVRG